MGKPQPMSAIFPTPGGLTEITTLNPSFHCKPSILLILGPDPKSILGLKLIVGLRFILGLRLILGLKLILGLRCILGLR